ncbi:MAG: polysaccharide deacetylase family protein [Motiliproteus sp.]
MMDMTTFMRNVFIKSGLGKLLWKNRVNGLYCFNFHRIGDWKKTEFDPCVYSCSEEDLVKYIDLIKSNFRVISMEELKEIVATGEPIREPLAMITFDDGYRDNFDIAFPILKSAAIPATFFITTSLIDSGIVPWWDEVAWHIRQLSQDSLRLAGWNDTVNITRTENYKNDVRKILKQMKSSSFTVGEQLEQLREITGKKIAVTSGDSMFMTWEQLKKITDSGMSIGAHSHSHKIFTELNEEELDFELSYSKSLLEEKLGIDVCALSYPVGGIDTYDSKMFSKVRSHGYEMAFTFEYFKNKNISVNCFRLGRFSVEGAYNEEIFKINCLLARSL